MWHVQSVFTYKVLELHLKRQRNIHVIYRERVGEVSQPALLLSLEVSSSSHSHSHGHLV
jgi:hypothetical protein